MSTQDKRKLAHFGRPPHRLQLISYPESGLQRTTEEHPYLHQASHAQHDQSVIQWENFDTLEHRIPNLIDYLDSSYSRSVLIPEQEISHVVVIEQDTAYDPFSEQDTAYDLFSEQDTVILNAVNYVIGSEQPLSDAMQSDIAGAAGDAASTGLGNFISTLFKYGTNFVIQRGLGAGEFGLYSLTMALIYLIATLFNLGLDDAMIRYIAIYRGKKQVSLVRGITIFSSIIVGFSGLLGALLVWYFSPQLAALEHKAAIAPLLIIMAPLIPLLTMQVVWMGGLQGFKDFKKSVLLQRIYSSVSLFLLFVVAFFFFQNIQGYMIMTLIGTLFATLLSLYYYYRKLSRSKGQEQTQERFPVRQREKYDIREWITFALPNFLTSSISIVLQSIDTLLLGIFAITNVAIGQYSAAIKFGTFISFPLTTMNSIFNPIIADLHHQGEHERLNTMFKILTKWIMTFSLPITGVIVLFSVPLLGLSGSSYTAGWPLLVVFAGGTLIGAGTGPVGSILTMTGHQKLALSNSLIAVALNLILGVILTPRMGAMGTAISTSAAVGCANFLRLSEVYLLEKLQPYRWDMLKPIGAVLLSGALTEGGIYALSRFHVSIEFLHKHLSLELSLIPVFIALYVFFLILFRFGPDDKVILDRLFKKIRKDKSSNPQSSRDVGLLRPSRKRGKCIS
jgi:O-antigen/teichoic acid export membrane protein